MQTSFLLSAWSLDFQSFCQTLIYQSIADHVQMVKEKVKVKTSEQITVHNFRNSICLPVTLSVVYESPNDLKISSNEF